MIRPTQASGKALHFAIACMAEQSHVTKPRPITERLLLSKLFG